MADYGTQPVNVFMGETSTFRNVISSTTNFIANEAGANNAIAGSLPGVGFTQGQEVYIAMLHTLQAGPNTFALNGGPAMPIVRHFTGNNIVTPYPVGAVLHLVAAFGRWQDLSRQFF